MMLSAIVLTFIVGYLLIILEKNISVNKAAFSLLTGVLCWVIYILGSNNPELINLQLSHHISEIAGILFFLLGAMTIVELIDLHNGFEVITSLITTTNKRKLLWIISFSAFFLSAILDNLTTAIIMTSLSRKLIGDKHERMYVLGIVIIAANAGGVWSPIGDVTTTMLWMNNKITALNIIKTLFLPGLVCFALPTFLASFKLKGHTERIEKKEFSSVEKRERNLVFFTGIAALLFVPAFKNSTHLPPYMGVLFGLAILWMITEIIHRKKETVQKEQLSVASAIQKTDVPSILFFLGILAAIAVLDCTGILKGLAHGLNETNANQNTIVLLIGLISSIVDNVPLVAAGMGMYDFPTDHSFWEFLAYTTGTGGSCLIIGSAAGVAVMGLEDISFTWYLKNISWLALLGFVAGSGVFILNLKMC